MAIAGTRRDWAPTLARPAVYILRTSDGGATYSEVAKLTASDAADDRGNSIGSTIGAEAVRDDDGGSYSGSAYVFRTTDGGVRPGGQVDGWTAAGRLVRLSVALDGDTLVVGACTVLAGPRSSSARATVASRTPRWSAVPLTPATGDLLGFSVAIDGAIVVGAYADDDGVATCLGLRLGTSDGVSPTPSCQADAATPLRATTSATPWRPPALVVVGPTATTLVAQSTSSARATGAPMLRFPS